MDTLVTTRFLNPVSYNGFLLQATPYRSMFLEDALAEASPEVATQLTQVASQFPVDAGRQPRERSIILHIQVQCPSTYTNEQAYSYIEVLYTAFNVLDEDSHYLIVRSPNGTRRISCRPEIIMPMVGMHTLYLVRLMAAEAPWEENSEQTDTQTDKNASPVNFSITAAGSMHSYPQFEITPSVVKAHANGYCRRMQIIIANKIPRTIMDTLGYGYPIEVGDTLDTATPVGLGHMQADGDDLHLFIDGKHIRGFVGENRYFGAGSGDPYGPDDDETKIWAAISFRPRKMAHNDGAMSNVSPANGESIHVDDTGGLNDWPQSGFFVMEDEVIYYGDRDSEYFYDIHRACRNTTAAGHIDSTAAYWVEHDIQLLYDYTAAAAGPIDANHQPVIDLANSTNAVHIYPGPFVDSDSPRPGQFLPTYRETNDIAPDLSLSLGVFGEGLEIVDTPPTAGKPQRNNLELYTPCGVDTGAGSLVQDVTVPNNMLARVYGTDMDGNEALLEEWNPDTDGAAESITPAGILTRLRYEGLVRTITGFMATAGAGKEFSVGAGHHDQYFQHFTLAQGTWLTGLALRLKKDAGATGDILVAITLIAAGGVGNDVAKVPNWTIDISTLTTSFATYAHAFANPVWLPAGDYGLLADGFNVATASAYWEYIAAAMYPGGVDQSLAGGAWFANVQTTMWFELFGDGSICQPEVPTGTAEYVEFDDIEVTFDTPPYTKVQAEESVYAYDATLENLTTGQVATIHFIGKTSEPLTIDCATREAYGGELALAMPWAVEWDDEMEGLYLVPGANSLRWTETGIGTITIVTTHRGRWA